MSQPIDQSWRSIVEYSEIPTTDNLYVIGSFAKSVTVYSQQVRAIGLVDALAGLGRLRQSSQVAVIGGGIAGMTAAAALCKIGIRPVIFEKEGTLAQLQRTSARRYLHPYVYDWPITSIETTDAKLPVLNWKAGMASDVIKDIDAQWNDISRGVISTRGEVVALQRVGRYWSIVSKEGTGNFNAVLSCIGFGVETGTYSYPYWADLPLDDAQIHSQSWVVSGAGDGALTDLMRLCIKNFLHGNALHVVVSAVEEAAGVETMKAFRQRVNDGVSGPELFAALDAKKISAKLNLRDNPVTLIASRAELFGTSTHQARSSVLNRLITWVLAEVGKIDIVSGRVSEGGISGHRGAYEVNIEGGETIACQDVLLRHGPVAPYGKYDNRHAPQWMDSRLGRPIKRLADRWKSLYQSKHLDPTIQREHWDDQMFARNRLSPDFREYSGLLLYSKSAVGGESKALISTVRSAVLSERVKSALGNSATKSQLAVICFEDALTGPRNFGRVIRALCDAPIAVFDGTYELPSLMLLLGVRSVVRRGVTLVVRKGETNAENWQEIAFNLRELNFLSIVKWSGLTTEDQVRNALEEGLKLQSRRLYRYADLPAFEGVRYLGAKKEDYEARTHNAEVLVLCPFDNDYSNNVWPEVQRALRDTWGNKEGAGPARRVIDLQSPEIVGNRLYGSIRRDAECIADLTLNRPNVFFELGVRLVANENGARVIRCTDFDDNQFSKIVVAEAQSVDVLLGTRPFTIGEEDPMQEVARAIQTDIDEWPGGTVTRSYPFSIAQDSVDIQQEAGGHGIASLLWNVKEETVGQDIQQNKSNPSLYVDNLAVRAQARRFAFDAMLAFVLFTDKLPLERRDYVRRAHALGEMDQLINDLESEQSEKQWLEKLLGELKGESS